ncbi:MAG: FKBP-type peptidyl-prolyl cis-trans isomerase [Planctomycetales bacterium]|nr:FKBP-type peptidyl-prolyl cis-trans isomerase [Planctomycetales bacterium]
MNRPIALIACCLLAASAAWVVAQESLPAGGGGPEPPATTPAHHSYAIGYDLGASFRADQIPLDIDSLLAGLRDGSGGAEPKYSQELLAAAMQRLGEQRLAVLRQRNLAFLQKNQQQPGVQTTRTGLQYQVLKQGTGATPTAGDVVRTHYTGTLIDGSVFDSTEGGPPAEFPVNRVIAGWTEALLKMKVGDRWRLFVPANLAYGEEGYGDAIPPHSTLIFELELVGIGSQPATR